eukprot:TRINITY_DN774_c0_g1_i8.p1 TRINITY_DN774_c0_g1~~TRINITY_DN774_c0_g1_i8.p1  ORF type:complete len:313 (+),score=26.69 TRINITY_DN774_c0_g1_i8:98-1036(+)
MKSQRSFFKSMTENTVATNRHSASTYRLPIQSRLRQCAEPDLIQSMPSFLLTSRRRPFKQQTNNPAQVIIKERLNEIDNLTKALSYPRQHVFNIPNQRMRLDEFNSRVYSPKASSVFERLLSDANSKHTQTRLGIHSELKKSPRHEKESYKEERIEDRLMKSQRVKSGQLSQRRVHAHILELKHMQNNPKISVVSSELGKAKCAPYNSLLGRFTALEEAKQKLRYDKFQEKVMKELGEVKEVPEINQRSKDLARGALERAPSTETTLRPCSIAQSTSPYASTHKKAVEILKRELHQTRPAISKDDPKEPNIH